MLLLVSQTPKLYFAWRNFSLVSMMTDRIRSPVRVVYQTFGRGRISDFPIVDNMTPVSLPISCPEHSFYQTFV